MRCVILLLAVLSCAAAEDADTKVWDHYQAFTKGQDGPEAVAAYRARLIAEGMSERDAWERVFLLDTIRNRVRAETWTSRFNRLYGSDQDVFSREPNAFLASVVRGLKPGTALDVSMGQGRNSVFLARKGWKVTGFDPAEEGLKVANAEAARAGVEIRTVASTYEQFDFGKQQWDLIVFCYAFAPLSDAALVRRVHDSLRPGGLVLIEHPMNEPEKAMHAHDRVNSLPRAFGESFRILFYEDTTGLSEWQQSPLKRSEDPRRMVRFLARRER